MKENEVITFDFKAAIEKIQLPIVVTTANPGGLCFLIDTGSSHCNLCDYVYEKLKEQTKPLDEKFNFSGVEGHNQVVNRVSMPLNICNQDYDVDFNIVNLSPGFDPIQAEKGIQLHGILGMDFLVKYGWKIDFAEQKIIIPKKG